MNRLLTLLAAPIVGLLTSIAAADEPYRLPPKVIADMIDAAPPPSLSVDPTGKHALVVTAAGMPSIADLAQPMLRLGGLRINPATNGRFTTSYNVSYVLKSIAGKDERTVEVPAGAKLGSPSWSPDGSRFAFTITRDDRLELWVADVATARAHRVGEHAINEAGGGYRWLRDGRRLLCRLVPADRGPAPAPTTAPTGPVIQESSGRTSPVRTYQDLLTNPHDEAMFEHLMTSQLAIVDGDSGDATLLGEPALYSSVSPSPNGRYLLVTRTVRPYSYQVPYALFPAEVEVWDMRGQLVKHVASLPLRDTTPIGGVAIGPRSHEWQPTIDSARLVWVEALDGGDPKNEATHRDRVLWQNAPFDRDPVEIARTEHRFSGLTWMHQSSPALLGEYDRDRRWTRTWLIDPGSDSSPRLVWDRSVRDRYGDPGRPMMTMNRDGHRVAELSNGRLLLNGRGASPEGDRPFLDTLDVETLETKRVWRCAPGSYETVSDFLGGTTVVTRHETPRTPPNYYLKDLVVDEPKPLTRYQDPSPLLRDVKKQLVTYERDDGVTLSATLYLPPDYEEGTRLPLLVWAYPREYNDPYTAGQVSGSQDRFTYIRGSSHLFLLTQGYAIMDGATMPVIGDAETMNDTFLDQIVASAKAAIDKAVDMGVADGDRVGVGGHSYGAFMTANLLAHCDLFRAGVARSGAYNRTLTPFGFQSERRMLWEAPMSYFRISPFLHAEKINEPMLMIHGEVDNNSGTFPLQSRRMYHAIKGLGGTARLVMLPHESHGYRARESVMHTVAEMVDWFDRYVKLSEE